jgi:predicted protein tyrosine phosphatase
MIDNLTLSYTIQKFRTGNVDKNLITDIIDNYREYPQYVIKFLTVYYSSDTADAVVNNIITTSERRSELMDCILSAYNVRLCDNSLFKNMVCLHGCECYSRKCWNDIYKKSMSILSENQNHFLSSFNTYNSMLTLVSKTDVLDDSMYHFINDISTNPKNWKTVIKFIKDSELFSSEYGDIIFMMRDLILENDKLDEKMRNKHISEFQNRAMLGTVLHKYNDMQKSFSRITNNIYISDIGSAKNVSILKAKKIHYVVSLTKKVIFRIDGIEYTQVMIDDIGTVDFIGATLDTVVDVMKQIKQNKTILVHCYKGLSRSVCFVILVLIHQGMTFDEAYAAIKNNKYAIDPNPEFIRQIIDYVSSHTFRKTN